jgi:hypothetical protein
MTNLSKAVAFFFATAFLIFVNSVSVIAQTIYFAGTSSGTGNTGNYVTGVGANVLALSNSGSYNSGFGTLALYRNTSGTYNTGIGTYALNKNTTGSHNTATGYASLTNNTTGYYNSASGSLALYSNTTGYYNTAAGRTALYYNTTGYQNVAVGTDAVFNNSSGISNIGIGYQSLYSNTTAGSNIGIGSTALYSNTSGSRNCAIGDLSMNNNTTGTDNAALGISALSFNSTGSKSVAIGNYAMQNSYNSGKTVSVGMFALQNPGAYNSCVAIGYTTGIGTDASGTNFHDNILTKCILIGDSIVVRPNTLVTNSIAIGSAAVIDVSNKAVIGNTSVTSIGGQVGWTTYSDQRLKTNINKSNLGLDFILSLNPVSYNYKAAGQKGILYTGLIAQEVDAAAKKAGIEFSAVDKNGEYWGIRYAELTVPLIKSMQELNDKTQSENEALKTRIEKLETAIGLLQQGIKPSTVLSASVLFQNQPNPFNNATTINFILSSSDKNVAIVIRNMNGAVVKQVNNLQAGKGSITINASELAAGTYTYSLITNGNIADTKLMVITK